MGSSCMCDFPIYVHYMPWKIPYGISTCLNSKPKFEASSCVLHFPICLLVGLAALFARFLFHLRSVFFRTLHHIHCLHPHSYTNAPKRNSFVFILHDSKPPRYQNALTRTRLRCMYILGARFVQHQIFEHFSHFRH